MTDSITSSHNVSDMVFRYSLLNFGSRTKRVSGLVALLILNLVPDVQARSNGCDRSPALNGTLEMAQDLKFLPPGISDADCMDPPPPPQQCQNRNQGQVPFFEPPSEGRKCKGEIQFKVDSERKCLPFDRLGRAGMYKFTPALRNPERCAQAVPENPEDQNPGDCLKTVSTNMGTMKYRFYKAEPPSKKTIIQFCGGPISCLYPGFGVPPDFLLDIM